MQAVLKCRVLSNNVCEYEVNQLTNEKVIRGKRNFNANCLRHRTLGRTDSPIYKPKFSSKNPSNNHIPFYEYIRLLHKSNIT